MRNRLIELFKGAESKVIEELNKHLELDEKEWMGIYADYLLANGVIPLPCKFQQKVYVLPTIDNNLPEMTEMKCIGFIMSCDSYNANLVTDKNKLYQPCFGDFGKTAYSSPKRKQNRHLRKGVLIMPEYIERERLITEIRAVQHYCLVSEVAVNLIKHLPSADVVEVVRCGQCGNYCKNTGECNLYGRHPNENDFCSSGVLKEREG